MSVTGIDAVTFGVTKQTKAKIFLDHWGLKRTNSGSYGANYICADGTEVHLRDLKNKRLPRAMHAGSTIREVIWGVQKQSDLNRIAKELSKDRLVKVLKNKSLTSIVLPFG